MKVLKRIYWGSRLLLAVPFWLASGLFLGAVEAGLLASRGLRLGQMGFARAGNWMAWGETMPDSVDRKIERRLNRLTMWRDKP